MKNTIIVIMFLFISKSFALAQNADAILGKWYSTDKDAIVEIFKEDQKYSGKITWLKEPMENGETYNCTIKMKNKDVLEVRGYLGISLVGRTVEWTCVKN
jgi:uncharacterized protein (DUF2147 family)